MAASKKGARHMREWSEGDMKKLRAFAKAHTRQGKDAGNPMQHRLTFGLTTFRRLVTLRDERADLCRREPVALFLWRQCAKVFQHFRNANPVAGA